MKTRSKNSTHGGSLQLMKTHMAPLLVWIIATTCVVFLFQHRTRRYEIVGVARGRVAQVASNCDGRLIEVKVGLFEKVTAGQTIAVIDTILDNERQPELVQAQLATVKAEIDHLTAQLASTEETLLTEKSDRETAHVEARRRFDLDVESARLQILSIRAQLASDMMTLKDLESDVKILTDLVEKDAIAPYELEKVRAQHDALNAKIKENQNLLDQAKDDLDTNLGRQEQYAKVEIRNPDMNRSLDVIRKAITVQEKMMEEFTATRQPVEIKAPIDGIVVGVKTSSNERMTARPGEDLILTAGEVVTTGQPILAIASEEPCEVVAYFHQNVISKAKENATVQLVKQSTPAKIAPKARISAVGPAIELMPEQLWRNPTTPQWGCPVVIEIPREMDDLVAGEIVGIRGF